MLAQMELEGPFGDRSCEDEIRALGQDEYRQYFFEHTPFCKKCLDPEIYLIVGRRGSGKTALANYFKFQSVIPGSSAIDVDEPHEYQKIIKMIAKEGKEPDEITIPLIARAWEAAIWFVIFRHMRDRHSTIHAACALAGEDGHFSAFCLQLIRGLVNRIAGKPEDSLAQELEKLLSESVVLEAKKAVLEILTSEPLIVGFDTLENYTIDDHDTMVATAALIECASKFNKEYAAQGLHFKLFVMAEVFPTLRQKTTSNLLKYIRFPEYLHWEPKTLCRFMSYRFWLHLKNNSLTEIREGDVDWESHKDVLAKIWTPYFGGIITNGAGLSESSFPYILRHTQLRPRQLIVLCNQIARISIEEGTFPNVSERQLRSGIKSMEQDLAEEVINSYKTVYENVDKIVTALTGIANEFLGSELDNRAKITSSQWPTGQYSTFNFRRLVSELGIVGKVRRESTTGGYIEADFEYAQKEHLTILPTDRCVIHPMFYSKFDVHMARKIRVYPLGPLKELTEVLLDY